MIEKKINYEFKKKEFLNKALVHRSYCINHPELENNERMEFLGDSILGFCVANYLFHTYKDLPEGELTKIRALVVCEQSLFKLAKKIGLGEIILLGKGEEMTNGRERPSILSDAMEAVFAAVYLDGGIKEANRVILSLLKEQIVEAVKNRDVKDYKTVLQEITQKEYETAPLYTLLKEEGPDHAKVFTVAVSLNGKALSEGVGKSKKEAEKQAAKLAIEQLKSKN